MIKYVNVMLWVRASLIHKDVRRKICRGVITPGAQVASGMAKDSPFARGTIAMQLPFFALHGVPVSELYAATLNVSIAPKVFALTSTALTMGPIKWSPAHQAEMFSLSPCTLIFKGVGYAAWVYYPHPATKIGHFKSDSLIEVLSQHIPQIQYGDKVVLEWDEIDMKISST
jgi:hypothetical protein